MLLSWLHKAWKFLLVTIAALCTVTLAAGIVLFTVLQFPQTRTFLTGELTDHFNNTYAGTLYVSDIEGPLPFRTELRNVRIHAPGEINRPVLSVENLAIRVDLWDLVRRNITINSFELERPRILLARDSDNTLTIKSAFARIHQPMDEDPPGSGSILDRLEVYAPSILIFDGHLTAEDLYEESNLINLPQTFILRHIDAGLHLEVNAHQQFMDIKYLTGELADNGSGLFSVRGQMYNDERYLEFNGFELQALESRVEFSGEISSVDITSPDFVRQLPEATLSLNRARANVTGENLASWFSEYPFTHQNLEIELSAEGTLETMHVDRLIAAIGESSIDMSGRINRIGSPDVSYQAAISRAVFQQPELNALNEHHSLGIKNEELTTLSGTLLTGRWSGNRDEVEGSFALETSTGNVIADGTLTFTTPLSYRAELELDSLDLSHFSYARMNRSLLNGRAGLSGSGTRMDDLEGTFSVELDSGYVNNIHFDTASFEGGYADRTLQHELVVEYENSVSWSAGWIRNNNGEWGYSLNGAMQNADIRSFWEDEELPHTSLTLEYSSEARWTHPDDLFGRVNFDVAESVIGADTLRPHQFYADIDPPSSNRERTLRLTSSFFDAEMKGDIYPENMLRLYHHWHRHIGDQIAEEVTMDTTRADTSLLQTGEDEIEAAGIRLELVLKDIDLFHSYLPLDLPLESRSSVSLNLNADKDQLLFTGTLRDANFRYGPFSATDLDASVTAGFRHDVRFRDYGNLDLQLAAGTYNWRNIDFHNGLLNASMRNDSLTIQHQTNSDEVQFDINLVSHLLPGSVQVEIRDFSLGNRQYQWVSEERPLLTWHENRSLELEQVHFTSDNERIEISGIYSSNPEDSVEYNIQDVQLRKISDLIGGRVTFSGIANGSFITQTLTRVPIIEGALQIRQARLNDRVIGEVSLNSSYSPSEDRFNTRASVITDPDRYPIYYEENDNIGQNLIFEGYVSAPDLTDPEREFYYFDADLREIDMWIVSVIVPDIVGDVEGRSSGQGYIRGSLTDFDFNASFDITDVTAVPFFLNTRYLVNGNLVFDRHDGLIFNNLDLSDMRGGSGLLYGSINLDNFSPTNYLDLTLDLDNLHFMNNPYDPDTPFYSNATGSGQARITGSNFSPYLRTTLPIVIAPGSRISVPVLDDTELQQSHSFIQFVDSFDWNPTDSRSGNGRPRTTALNGNENLTFIERFTLDLQFIADDPVTFQLVFDRVTNEILTAQGTGQLRLSLEDQSFSLFGRMNIAGGDYQFVAGDIISRRFQLLEGGTIIWEGDPANARLNVNATYRSRPNLSSLLTSGSVSHMEGGQRFPVDLVLHIGGTLAELENDFFFEIPSSIEGTLDPTLLTQVNALNRNEEEKVIQATSILLSGNFIPLTTSSADGGSGTALRESLTSGSVVVNPLITSQVINPLLSDQINSLLRSDMSLDIDFNLTQFNQIDLGVALRLYDDRLILRRDGQITGPYSDIGDLGATYRINRTFAVTAFHRQDPTLTSTSATEPRQMQEMNGVGLEAQIQFNTWQEFRNRFTRAIGRLFGRKEQEENQNEQKEEPGEEEDILVTD